MIVDTQTLTELATPRAAGPDLQQYLLFCGLMVLTLVGFGIGMRRFVTTAVRNRAAKRSLQILDAMPLGGRKKLAVVRCYDRSFLVGLGEREINLIAELSEEPGPELQPAEPAVVPVESPEVRPAFQRLLAKQDREAKAQPAPTKQMPTMRRGGILG